MIEEEFIISTDYSGLGSPEEAFKRLKVKYRIAFACEKDVFARNSYFANHDAPIFYEDVTTRNNKTAPYSDFYAAGFPCQAFSISGKRLGFEDTRGTLFFNSLEYIAIHKPRVITFENVKGLLSHDKVPGSKSKYGRTFGVIRDALAFTINGQHNLYKYDDCVNYHIHFQVLNTKDYGLPQNRERIFIVGFRDEEDSIRFKFPKKIPLQLRLKDLLERNVPEKYYLSEAALSRLIKRGDNVGDEYISRSITTKNQQSNLSFKNASTLISDDIIKVGYINQDTQASQVYGIEGISPSLCSGSHGYAMGYIEDEPKIGAERGRYNKEGKIEQQLEINDTGNTNTITSVAKDNLVIEDDFIVKTSHVSRNEEAKQIRKENMKKGKDYSPFAKKEVSLKETGIMNTLTTAISKDNLILIEKPIIENESILFDKENTAKGYAEVKPGDSINISNPNSKTRRGRVGDQIANTLDTACNQAVLLPLYGTEKGHTGNRIYDSEGIARTQIANGGGMGAKTGLYLTGKRIRRLTPLECFRLQGYSDEFFEKCASVNSDTQLYKQAGNSISVDTFMYLLIQILIALKIPYTYND